MSWLARVSRSLPGVRAALWRYDALRRELATLRANQAAIATTLADRARKERTSRATAQPGAFLTSCLCTEARFAEPEYEAWCAALGEPPKWHRKQWELVFVARALAERGVLAHGKRVIGFGVGDEPLPALFAGSEVDVLATSQESERAAAEGWAEHGQSIADRDVLRRPAVCDDATFERRVAFRTVDMNAIPDDLAGRFDGLWSACALEHLGSLELGRRFVLRSLDCLVPGGVAVHTTEVTLSSNERTIESGRTVLFRRRDVEELVRELERAGHRVAPLDWTTGEGLLDRYVDVAPYRDQPHLRLLIGEHVCTSIGLIVEKDGDRRTRK